MISAHALLPAWCLGFTRDGRLLIVGAVNFARNRSGPVDCVVGEVLSYCVRKLGMPELETRDMISSKGACGLC